MILRTYVAPRMNNDQDDQNIVVLRKLTSTAVSSSPPPSPLFPAGKVYHGSHQKSHNTGSHARLHVGLRIPSGAK